MKSKERTADNRLSDYEQFNYGVELIAEIKIEKYDFTKPEKRSYGTWLDYIYRAYGLLGDMRNWEVSKYVLLPYVEPKGDFDPFLFFGSIDVVLLDCSKTEDVETFIRKLKDL